MAEKGTKMLRLCIPGKKELEARYLLLDLNGTLALDGTLLPDVQYRIARLSDILQIYLVTCDTHGNGSEMAEKLGIGIMRTGTPGPLEAQEKARVARSLGVEHIIAIGNGDADALMLEICALGIGVLGPEGLSVKALLNADIVVRNICDALDLLLIEKRLIATLRGST